MVVFLSVMLGRGGKRGRRGKACNCLPLSFWKYLADQTSVSQYGFLLFENLNEPDVFLKPTILRASFISVDLEAVLRSQGVGIGSVWSLMTGGYE